MGNVGKAMSVVSGFIPDPATASVLGDVGTGIEATAELVEAKKREKDAKAKMRKIEAKERKQLQEIRIENKRIFNQKLGGNRSLSGGSMRLASNKERKAKGGVIRVAV